MNITDLAWVIRVFSWLATLWRFLTTKETIVVRHSTLQTWKFIARCRSRILLHAAFYPTYSNTADYDAAFRGALSKGSFGRLEVLVVDEDAVWLPEFVKVLRPQYTVDQFRRELASSRDFFLSLKGDYPNKVFVFKTKTLPLVPMVVIDNLICVGHYAHSPVLTPDGYWLRLKSDVRDLLDWAEHGTAPIGTKTRKLACYRFIAEFVRAKKEATELK